MTLFKHAKIPSALIPDALTLKQAVDVQLDPAMLCDIRVSDTGVIQAVSSSRDGLPEIEGEAVVDLAGCMVLPGFIDAHTHLDKAHSWFSGPNPRGEFWDAIEAIQGCRDSWNEADLFKRADFTLESAWAHGTSAVRTHVDTDPSFGETSHRVMAALKEKWADRITLQTVGLTTLEEYATPSGMHMAENLKTWGCDLLGGFPVMNERLDAELDALFALAKDLQMGLDLHVDENGDASTECLKHIAQAVLRHEFTLPVTCGHCCSLSLQEPERQSATIQLVKEAGIHIISLPMCNIYLQGRQWSEPESNGYPKTPNWRGVTQLHEFMEAGVTVACASDNVRDAFYAYGDLDMFEVLLHSVRIGHLDTRLEAAPAVATKNPAAIMGLTDYGKIDVGCRADFVVFPGKNFSEWLSRPYVNRQVYRKGKLSDAVPPDYSELSK